MKHLNSAFPKISKTLRAFIFVVALILIAWFILLKDVAFSLSAARPLRGAFDSSSNVLFYDQMPLTFEEYRAKYANSSKQVKFCDSEQVCFVLNFCL
jgi:hypothetical protein